MCCPHGHRGQVSAQCCPKSTFYCGTGDHASCLDYNLQFIGVWYNNLKYPFCVDCDPVQCQPILE